MNARYVDVHCHLQFDHYAADAAELIERMRERGVVAIVVGVDLESSRRAVALAQAHEHLFAAVGLHPNSVEAEAFDPEALRALAAHPRVVAIGECGLDNVRPSAVTDDVKRAQCAVLSEHIVIAAELDKPLIIHARPARGTQDAYHELIGVLADAKREHPNVRGDIHFFVGGEAEAEQLRLLGFSISFTAVITFARDYDAVIKATPLESILAETDAPYVAPASRRGTRNDPLAVEEVVAQIATIRGEDPEAVRAALRDNAGRVFRLPLAA